MLKLLRNLLLVLGIGCGLLVGWIYATHQAFLQTPLAVGEAPVDYAIEPGTGVRALAADLNRRGWLEAHPAHLEWLARSSGLDTRIQAGEYRIEPGTLPLAVLQQFAEGRTKQYRLTIIEGWTFARLREELAAHPALRATLDPELDDAALMQQLGSDLSYAEGWFLPDTYVFPRGTSDLDFLRRAHAAMRDYLQTQWQERAEDLPLKSAEEALILASIVEKETGVAEERGLIAGVFAQRLKRRMRLQTDPTVIYGLGETFDGDLRFRDLRRDTPYNTYTRHGLPPTPIALPGREAIRAAVQPEETQALYFVSTGDGRHVFSATLEEHNQAVRKYQLNR